MRTTSLVVPTPHADLRAPNGNRLPHSQLYGALSVKSQTGDYGPKADYGEAKTKRPLMILGLFQGGDSRGSEKRRRCAPARRAMTEETQTHKVLETQRETWPLLRSLLMTAPSRQPMGHHQRLNALILLQQLVAMC